MFSGFDVFEDQQCFLDGEIRFVGPLHVLVEGQWSWADTDWKTMGRPGMSPY